MIEFLTANMAEILMTLVFGAVSTLIATLKSGFGDLKKDVEARKVLWDEEMIRINHKFDELMADHSEIKRELKHISKELGEKVEKIMSDHSEHDKSMAAVLEMVRVIERRTE